MKKHLIVWTLTAALLAGAWTLNRLTLPEDAPESAFSTIARLDEPATTRNLAVTVTDVRRAHGVTDADGWSADGNWIVVDIEAAAVVTQRGTGLRLAELVVDGRTFHATERGTTFHRQQLVPGVPRSGTLAFEVPTEITSGQATLRFGTSSDERLDGIIELHVELDDLTVQNETVLDENGWAR